MDRLELSFMGTASGFPTPHRGVSCTALSHDSGIWLFDCGEGSQIQLMKSHLKPGKVNKVFITHLHGDHLYGLPGLLCTISQNNQRDSVVEIFGPVGLRHYLCTSLFHSRSDIQFSFRVIEMTTLPCQDPENVKEWPMVKQTDVPFVPSESPGWTVDPDDNHIWHLHSDDKLTVKAVWVKHKVPSFAFVIQESERPGKLNADKLKKLGIPPGPKYAKLKLGESIYLDDGTELKPEEVMSDPIPGRLLVIGGDSCDSSELTKLANKATVFVHEATMENGLTETCIQNGHSTPAMTAGLAKQLDVETLILTHFSQRYRPLGTELKDGDQSVEILRREAGEIFPIDRIHLTHDLWVFPVPRKLMVTE